MRAFEAGGWKTLDGLYTKPPTSTEQMLHPATKLIGTTREEPKAVTLPKLPGTELTNNVMGELQWQIYLQQWNVKEPKDTEGWGGDRYAVMQDKDHVIGYFASTWDTEADA